MKPNNHNSLSKVLNTPFTIHWLLAIITSAIVIRVIYFTLRYSVNILFYDQWAFYSPLFNYQNLWQLFSWQHGPHREGIGLIVSKVITDITGWNTIADSLAITILLILGMILAFQLKRKLIGSLSLWDLVIPFLFLTLFQYEGIVVIANLSYGAFPVALIMLYCLSLFIKKRGARYPILLLINFVTIYTGWGLFMGFVTPLLFIAEAVFTHKKRKNWLPAGFAGLVSIISMVLFFTDYLYAPSVSCFGFSTSYLLQYPIFIGLMKSAFFGLHMRIIGNFAIPVGLFLLGYLLLVLFYHGRQIVKQSFLENKVSIVIVILISYSLIFCLFTAVGRICTGIQLAQVSRYMTLLIPGFLGLYFHLLTIRKTKVSTLLIATYFIATSLGSLPLGIIEGVAEVTYISKMNWKSCYLQTQDIETCNKQTNFIIYPDNSLLIEKIDYLQKNNLNLFKN